MFFLQSSNCLSFSRIVCISAQLPKLLGTSCMFLAPNKSTIVCYFMLDNPQEGSFGVFSLHYHARFRECTVILMIQTAERQSSEKDREGKKELGKQKVVERTRKEE